MNTSPSEQTPAPEPPPAGKRPNTEKKGCLPHGCGLYLFLGFVGFVLLMGIIPSGSHVQVRGSQTKALAQAKQIGLALKLFAGDHEGNYPRIGVPEEVKDAPANANEAFACLFPTYTQSESIFGNTLSAYQTHRPDNKIDNPFVWKPKNTLQAGENVYGYVMGLREDSPPDAPVICDGTDGTGHYNTNTKLRGGVWKGQKAVVIRLDNSGALENLTGPEDTRYIARRVDRAAEPLPAGSKNTPYVPQRDLTKNLLDVDYFGKNVRYLDPAR